MNSLGGKTFLEDMWLYAKRMEKFDRVDWRVYFSWCGMMVGLMASVGGFTIAGYLKGVEFPAYVWNIPLGTFIFIVAIAFDTIGHRTAYKEALKSGESLVHHITIAAGISSCVLLCLAYSYRDFFAIPALVMTALSIFYSVIDEAMHWFRYHSGNSDRVEMWSHFFIFVGHVIMMVAWVHWFLEGYPGVTETLTALYGAA
jgi:hypothetical protein